jgi:hypothetical protein
LPETLTDDLLPDRWPDYGKWLVHHLYLRRHLDRRYMDGSFSPVHSQTLRKILPQKHYQTILSLLTQEGVIERKHSYWNGGGAQGGYSKGCRLTEVHREARFGQHWVHHPELAQKLAKRKSEQESKYLDVHRHLQKMMEDVESVGDYPLVYLPLMAIANGDFLFKVCPYGRVHTNLTSLPREYRKHIRWQGRPLWLIDVVNSQPLILALALKKQAQTTHNHTQPPTTYQPKHQSLNLATHSDRRLMVDAERYLDRCLAGRIYEDIADRLADEYPHYARLTPYERRERVKKRFFAVAYGQKNDMFTQVGNAFRDLFPACFWTIRGAKPPQVPRRKKGEPRIKLPGHGELAKQMQRLESDIVIDTACERLRRERPEACLLTIHDCLLTTAEHKDYFAQVLADAFDEKYGVRPKLKFKLFAGDDA